MMGELESEIAATNDCYTLHNNVEIWVSEVSLGTFAWM